MDPIVYRGIERLLIVIGAIFFGYLGYRLFEKGLTAGEGNLKFESKAMKILFSGTGPGLFFMAFGAIVLMVAIAIGGVSIKETTTSPVTSVVQPTSAEPENLEAAKKRIAELTAEITKLTAEKAVLVRNQSNVDMRMKLPPDTATPTPPNPKVTQEREIEYEITKPPSTAATPPPTNPNVRQEREIEYGKK